MTEYLVLLKLSPTKVIDTINDLRELPQKPSPGVDLEYVMNVFGTRPTQVLSCTQIVEKII